MREAKHIVSLRQVSAIRDLQRAAAETQAARAAAARRETDEALAQSEKRRTAAEDNWRAAMTGAVVQIETLPLWSSVLLRQDRETRAAQTAADDAAAELGRRKAAWLAASRHNDVAKDLVSGAVRERARALDEIALHDAADMHHHRRAEA